MEPEFLKAIIGIVLLIIELSLFVFAIGYALSGETKKVVLCVLGLLLLMVVHFRIL